MSTVSRKGTVPVWSVPVRLFHWSLVASVTTAWLGAEHVRNLHEYAGYAAAALVAFRLVVGFVGSGYARFSQFVRSPLEVLRYMGDIMRGRERRYVGHNPAGGAMVLALIACICGIALTGWMQTTDAYWGVVWVENTHKFLGNAIVVLVMLHIAGVLLASLRHGENLVRAMINGHKSAATSDDVA